MKHDLMFFNLVTDIVTVVSLYILLYFIFAIVSMFLHMLHFIINIQQVLKLIELSTIIRYIQRRVKLYPTGKPDCSNKVCKWSLFMFAPAHPARFPSLFGVLSAPASVTPVVHGAVVCCLGPGSTGALPMPKANSLHVYSNRYYKPISKLHINVSKQASNIQTFPRKTARFYIVMNISCMVT